MANTVIDIGERSARTVKRVLLAALIFFALIVVFRASPITVIPAGHVGVKDLFGSVSPDALPPGVHAVFPFTKVVKMSIQTQELKEAAEVPSKEGLVMDLEASLLYRLDPERGPAIYKSVGADFPAVAGEPQIRSPIPEITASYEAKGPYSAAPETMRHET